MKTDGMKKQERLLVIIGMFEKPGCRYRTREIADKLSINEDTAGKYLQELSGSGTLPITKDGHVWILPEGSRVPLKGKRISFSCGKLANIARDVLPYKKMWHGQDTPWSQDQGLVSSLDRNSTLCEENSFGFNDRYICALTGLSFLGKERSTGASDRCPVPAHRG